MLFNWRVITHGDPWQLDTGFYPYCDTCNRMRVSVCVFGAWFLCEIVQPHPPQNLLIFLPFSPYFITAAGAKLRDTLPALQIHRCRVDAPQTGRSWRENIQRGCAGSSR